MTNVLVDQTHGLQYIKDIEDSLKEAFTQLTCSGPLSGEPLRGVRFNLVDANIHPDRTHRGPNQIVSAFQQSMSGALLAASPALMEPIYRVDVVCPESVVTRVYNTIAQRQGEVQSEEMLPQSNQYRLNAFIPVRESLGLTGGLRSATGGQAFLQASFSHWKQVPGDVYDESSIAHEVLKEIRSRKGFKPEIPVTEQFMDRL
eukprot:gb/GECH01007502.1/.p1 GENE.gb/GECH01007502.1/~~gb/GECH01007502.1/.p1  ORF type:complete len:202 (+),score=35.55 gb/GECH01007502.1/:1-606(+)